MRTEAEIRVKLASIIMDSISDHGEMDFDHDMTAIRTLGWVLGIKVKPVMKVSRNRRKRSVAIDHFAI